MILPLMGPELAEQLRTRGGFATVAEALADFLRYSELMAASTGQFELESVLRTHLRNSSDSRQRRPVPEWL